MPRGNRTTNRGRGPLPSRIVIEATEGRALRAILAERHGYSVEEAIPALLSGELATVLLGDEERWYLLRWIDEATPDLEDDRLREVLQSIGRQLRTAAELSE